MDAASPGLGRSHRSSRQGAADVQNDPFLTHTSAVSGRRPADNRTPPSAPATDPALDPGRPTLPLPGHPGGQQQTPPPSGPRTLPPGAAVQSSLRGGPSTPGSARLLPTSGVPAGAVPGSMLTLPPFGQQATLEPLISSWYPAENNWNLCLEKMRAQFVAITTEFTGQAIVEQRLKQGSMLEQARGVLYDSSGGRLGRPTEMKTMSQRVLKIYQDVTFPPQNEYWFRGGESADFPDIPTPWRWMRLMELSMNPYPVVDPAAGGVVPKAGRVYQGQLEDFYLAAALQTIGMKPQLVANLFVNLDFSRPQLGLYTLRLYKHGQWINVDIDDALPFDKEYSPLTCSGEYWPNYAWPALVEKAYAKLHGCWQALGGGGHVEEVLTDLTGGCSTRFGSQDVACDRLWQYLNEMQKWCVFGCNINEVECNKRGIRIRQHWASSIFRVAKHQGVPLVCVCTAAPVAAVRQMPVFDVPSPEGYGVNDGMAWLRIDDFVVLFDTVYECRLVNSDLGPPQMTGIPYSPAWVVGYPWFEEMWAFQGDVYNETAPAFFFDIRDCPNEITLEVSQTDLRYHDPHEDHELGRGLQAPLLLRFFQCSEQVSEENGGEIYLVHLSAWGHTRDACCGVKVMKPGKYLAMVSIPAQYVCHRMIFRTYSTRPLATKVVTQHRNLISVSPAQPLDAIPYSLCGMMNISTRSQQLPQQFNEAEGRGLPMANPRNVHSSAQQNGLAQGVSAALSGLVAGAAGAPGGGGTPGEHGLKVVGKFGGTGAMATRSSEEVQECGMM